MDREKQYQIYHTMLSIVLTWALTLGVNQYFELRVTVFLCAFFSAAPAILIYLFDTNRKNSISYLILFSILPITAFILWLRKVNPIIFIQEIVNWCRVYNGSEATYHPVYPKFLIFSLALVGSIIFYLLMKRLTTKVIVAVLLLLTLIVFTIYEATLGKMVVGICLFYILTILVEICGILYNRKAKRQDNKAGILYLAPVCMLLALLSIAMPSKEEPMQWKGIKNIYHNLVNQIDSWFLDMEYYFSKSEAEFALQFTGYDENPGELGRGGKLSKDNRVVIRASGHRTSKPIYLIGSISDVYTGHSWEKSHLDFTSEEDEYFLDYTELIYALSRLERKTLEEEQLIERKSMTIEYTNMKTKTCFYPIKSSWIDISKSKAILDTTYADIVFAKAQGKGTRYQTVSYELNLNSEAFAQLLREADGFTYEGEASTDSDSFAWLKENMLIRDNANSYIKGWTSYSVLDQRAKMIKEQYTQLPIELPERIRELANNITKDYDTSYDKLRALESFLTTYPYTLHPGELPKGADFVDYFLFDNQEGYCTSFASAMAVLGRCVGIPTRYVEGFILTYKGDPVNGMYPIKNSQAHAWAEAYIKGVGWIPFEATATYYDSRYITWPKKSQVSTGSSTITPPIPYNQHNMGDIKPGEQEQVVEEEVVYERSSDILNGIIIGIVTIMIIILMLLLYYSINKIKYRKAFDRADNSTRMYLLFLRILRLLQMEGYYLNEQETILMLANRVKNTFQYEEITFSTVAATFMQYRYAQESTSQEEYEKVVLFHRGLLDKQKEERGRLQMLLEEFVFLSKKQNRLAS